MKNIKLINKCKVVRVRWIFTHIIRLKVVTISINLLLKNGWWIKVSRIWNTILHQYQWTIYCLHNKASNQNLIKGERFKCILHYYHPKQEEVINSWASNQDQRPRMLFCRPNRISTRLKRLSNFTQLPTWAQLLPYLRLGFNHQNEWKRYKVYLLWKSINSSRLIMKAHCLFSGKSSTWRKTGAMNTACQSMK